MAKKFSDAKSKPVGTRSTASQTSSATGKVRDAVESVPTNRQRLSASLDARVIYCGDKLEQLRKLPDACIDYMRPRCVELGRVLKKTGSSYYHCDWHASHYVKVMLKQIFGENDNERQFC